MNRVEFDGHDPHANYDACHNNGGSTSGCGRHAAAVSNQQSHAANGTNGRASGGGAMASSPGPNGATRQAGPETPPDLAIRPGDTVVQPPSHPLIGARSDPGLDTVPVPHPPTGPPGQYIGSTCYRPLAHNECGNWGDWNKPGAGSPYGHPYVEPMSAEYVLTVGSLVVGPEMIAAKIGTKLAPRALEFFRGLRGERGAQDASEGIPVRSKRVQAHCGVQTSAGLGGRPEVRVLWKRGFKLAGARDAVETGLARRGLEGHSRRTLCPSE